MYKGGKSTAKAYCTSVRCTGNSVNEKTRINDGALTKYLLKDVPLHTIFCNVCGYVLYWCHGKPDQSEWATKQYNEQGHEDGYDVEYEPPAGFEGL